MIFFKAKHLLFKNHFINLFSSPDELCEQVKDLIDLSSKFQLENDQQRKKLEEMQDELNKKDEQLAEYEKLTSKLQAELDEKHEQFAKPGENLKNPINLDTLKVKHG